MIAWIENKGVPVGVFPVLEALAPGLRVYTTSRSGGSSPGPFGSLNLGEGLGEGLGDLRSNVSRNRRALLSSLGINPRMVARAVQVHGSDIEIVTRGGLYREVDGFVTARRGLTLVIGTADCYPVIMYAPSEMALAALHVGIGGASRGIIPRAAGILSAQFGADIPHTVGLIGPGICSRCYTVNEDRAAPFPERFKKRRDGRVHLDLPGFCAEQLASSGLDRKNIYRSDLCTSCDPARFYSYRRDRGRTGRQWTLATIAATSRPPHHP